MKRLSVCLLALALATCLVLPGTARTATANPAPNTAAAGDSKDARFQYMYYWYTYPADGFFDRQTLVVEEMEWWIMLGYVQVDTNPAGGTLVARGYMTSNFPHVAYASAYLYAHYGF